MLHLYLEAFTFLRRRPSYTSSRDQPALMVALSVAVSKHGLRHHDMASSFFCRNKISKVVSCDAGCLVVHKPAKHDSSVKVFLVGAFGTGAVHVAMMLDMMKIEPRCSVALRLRAADAADRGDDSAVWEAADSARVFWDAPWSSSDVYARLATKYPRAKFVLTLRAEEEWWPHMDRGLRCATAGKRAKLAERVLGEPFLETALETALRRNLDGIEKVLSTACRLASRRPSRRPWPSTVSRRPSRQSQTGLKTVLETVLQTD
mmetsp:Transcript_23036/g.78794  ORF Transcript_23036/g.78794 Transcript_23036/m.78794 type:complete len:261 (+) Transcript_23036:222-1004(+)